MSNGLKHIIRLLMVVLLGGYALLLLLLNFGPLQQWLTNTVCVSLSEWLQTEIRIKEVQVGLFNRVVLHDVYIADRKGEAILDGKLISGKIEILPLLSGEVSLRSVSLLDAKISLYKETPDSPANYDFIIKAFDSGSKDETSKLNLRVNSLILRRCNVDYDVRSEKETPHLFNKQHISVRDIDANISLKHLTNDSLCLRVRKFAFREESGLNVKSLKLQIEANRHVAQLKHFYLELPNTKIDQKDIYAQYDASQTDVFLKTLKLNGEIAHWVLSTSDFQCFANELKTLNHRFTLSSLFRITPDSLKIDNFKLHSDNEDFMLMCDGLMARKDGKFHDALLNVERLVASEHLLKNVQTVLNDKGVRVPSIQYDGFELKGRMKYASDTCGWLQLNYQSEVGAVDADLELKKTRMNGAIAVQSLNIARILKRDSLPTLLDADVDLNLNFTDKKIPIGTIHCTIPQVIFKNYPYKNINIDFNHDHRNLVASVQSDDHNAALNIQVVSQLEGSSLKNISTTARVYRLHPKNIHLTSHFGGSSISFNAESNLREIDASKKIAFPEGILTLNDLKVYDKDTFHLKKLDLNSAITSLGTRLHLKSDFGVAVFEGPLSFSQIKHSLSDIIANKLPHFVQKQEMAKGGNWKFMAQFSNTDFLPAIARIPLSFPSGIFLEGGVQTDNQQVLFAFKADSVLLNDDVVVTSPSILVKNIDGEISTLLKATRKVGKTPLHFELDAKTDSGNIEGQLQWRDVVAGNNYGLLRANVSKTTNGTLTTTILPTKISIDDTLWHVRSGNIMINQPLIQVDNFHVQSDRGGISIDGKISAMPTDTLSVALKNVDVNYFLKLFNIKPVEFSGLATGLAKVHTARTDSIAIDARLNIPSFKFNQAVLGDANICLNFNTYDGKLTFDQTKIIQKGIGHTYVDGYVCPAQKNLDLYVESKRTNLAFLNKYVAGILKDIEGNTSGNTRIFGLFKNIDFSGEQHPTISATIPATNVRYNLYNGSIQLSPGLFKFNTFQVSDRELNSAAFQGEMRHQHLKRIEYQFNLSNANNLLLYDRGRSIDMPFYATVYGDGNMSLQGQPGQLHVNASVAPRKKTLFVYTVDDPSASGGDNRLLRFEKNTDQSTDVETNNNAPLVAKTSQGTHLLFNFDVNMQPEATLRVITNAKSGDYLDLNTSGNILATYDSKGYFTLRNPLTVEGGVYQMNIQNFINKRLTFRPGGQIHFNGNPFEATLNLEAMYTVPSVSLSDLNIGSRLSTATTPVNCLFYFNGTAGAPQIDFGFELPNASDEVEQMVQDLISTEDDKKMQALYLLGIGRFYTYNYASTEAAESQSQTSVAMKSFLSSTLTSQLNNILKSAMPSANWSFGANLATGNVGWSDMEVEGILSGRLLSGRLLLNGNFGYRERANNFSNTHFVGDFDVEYLLTPTGNVSLRAYSETNDRYFSTSSLTTQGIGIKLGRQFNTLQELFKPSYKIQPSKKKKRKNKEAKR